MFYIVAVGWSFTKPLIPIYAFTFSSSDIEKLCQSRRLTLFYSPSKWWHNHLNPAIKKEAWTAEEVAILICAHQIYGNKWAETKLLPGRADNLIKNHGNCSMKRSLDTYFASGLPVRACGLLINDLNYFARQKRSAKADSVMESIKDPVLPDQKPTADEHFMASSLVHQSANPGRLDLDLQLIPPRDSKCSRGENQPSSVKISKCIRGEVEPILKEDSKCTSLEETSGAKNLS